MSPKGNIAKWKRVLAHGAESFFVILAVMVLAMCGALILSLLEQPFRDFLTEDPGTRLFRFIVFIVGGVMAAFALCVCGAWLAEAFGLYKERDRRMRYARTVRRRYERMKNKEPLSTW